MLGPWSSYCGQVEIPILNRAPGGPLPIVSPERTHAGLTRGGPVTGRRRRQRGRAGRLLPDRRAQLLPRRAARGPPGRRQCHVREAARAETGLRARRPRASGSRSTPIHSGARRRRLGLRIAGSRPVRRETTKNLDALAARVARSGAEGVYLAGLGSEGGDRVLKSLRNRLGTRLPIMATDPFVPIRGHARIRRAGRARAVRERHRRPARRARPDPRRPSASRATSGPCARPSPASLPAAQAAELVLRAIARSDGTRASVLEELRGGRGQGRHPRRLPLRPQATSRRSGSPIFRVTGRTPPGEPVFEHLRRRRRRPRHRGAGKPGRLALRRLRERRPFPRSFFIVSTSTLSGAWPPRPGPRRGPAASRSAAPRGRPRSRAGRSRPRRGSRGGRGSSRAPVSESFTCRHFSRRMPTPS